MHKASRLRRSIGLGVSLVLVAAAATAVSTAAAAPGQAVAGGGLAGALAQARATGHRVEVPSLGTETDEVYADPTGTVTVDEYAQPARVTAGNGTWKAIDNTLRFGPDGTVAPVTSPLDITLSGGGATSLVSLGHDGRRFDLGWPGPLPKPVLGGDLARYPEVLPGVDLEVRVDATGFSENLVVKTRAAAADPALTRVRFTTSVSHARLRPGAAGSVAVVDDSGAVVFGAGTPVMSDAHARTATMPVSVAPDGLTITPDQGLLTNPGTAFPVRIDPSVTVGPTWTMINQRHPDQSYWSYDRDEGAKVGYVEDANDGWERYRSVFTFNAASFAHKHVLGAVFSATLTHSWSCSASRTDLYALNPVDSGTTWNNEASSWAVDLANVSNQSCDDTRLYTEWGGSALVGKVQGGSNAGTQVTLGLKAYDETDHDGWKTFDPATVKLSVTYNSYPNTPSNLTVDGHTCVTGAGRPFVGSLTPTLRAAVSDPDGGLLDVWFAWAKVNPDGSYQSPWPSGHQTNVASGATAQLTLPTLVDGQTYAFRSQAGDGIDSGGTSGWCEFTVDATAPNQLPTVASADGVYLDDGAFHGGVGRTGSFTLGANAVGDVAGFLYGPSDPPTTSVAADSLGGGATIAVTPLQAGLNTLYVRSYDRAGNESGKAAYTFYVGSPTPPSGLWEMDEGSGTALGDASGHGYTATVTGNATWTSGRVGVGGPDGAITLDGATAYAATAGPVIDTSKSFAVAAWVRLARTGGYETVVSQLGTHSSAFYLQYRADDQHWAFTYRDADTDTAVSTVADSHSTPTLSVWTHVAGVYNAGSKQLEVYVNGKPAAAATLSVPAWNATGPLLIGAAETSSARADYLPGDVDDVRVWDRAVTPTELAQLVNSGRLAGQWDLDDGHGDTAADTSGFGHYLTLQRGTGWTTGHNGLGALTFPGTTGAASGSPAILTDESFTVSAWVRLAKTGSTGTAVSQDGAHASDFALQYRADTGKWAFVMNNSDSATTTTTTVNSTTAAQATTWTHLVGEYDAAAKQVKLYVNGQLAATTAFTTPWRSAGAFVLGRDLRQNSLQDYLTGDVDDVRVYAGVLTDQEVVDLYYQ